MPEDISVDPIVNDPGTDVPGAEPAADQQSSEHTEPAKTDILPTTTRQPSRFTKTVIFSPAEFTELEKIFNARKEAGITEDWNHFIRQLMDFALNYNRGTFAVPDDVKVIFKKGFLNTLKK